MKLKYQNPDGELLRYSEDNPSIFELINPCELRANCTFSTALSESARNKELIKQFERFAGMKMMATAPIDMMVDKATGFGDYRLKQFIYFVYDFIWSRLPITGTVYYFAIPPFANKSFLNQPTN